MVEFFPTELSIVLRAFERAGDNPVSHATLARELFGSQTLSDLFKVRESMNRVQSRINKLRVGDRYFGHRIRLAYLYKGTVRIQRGHHADPIGYVLLTPATLKVPNKQVSSNEIDMGWFQFHIDAGRAKIWSEGCSGTLALEEGKVLKVLFGADGKPVTEKEFPDLSSVKLLQCVKGLRSKLGAINPDWADIITPGSMSFSGYKLRPWPSRPKPEVSAGRAMRRQHQPV
jgi:hypothetical protein